MYHTDGLVEPDSEASFTARELNWNEQVDLVTQVLIGHEHSPARQRHDLLCIDWLQTLQRTRSRFLRNTCGTVHTGDREMRTAVRTR